MLGLSQEGHWWHGTAAAEQRAGVTGQGAGGCGRANPGTILGSVRAQLLWLGRVQLGRKAMGQDEQVKGQSWGGAGLGAACAGLSAQGSPW